MSRAGTKIILRRSPQPTIQSDGDIAGSLRFHRGSLLMQITEHPGAEQVEFQLVGRIDATWAEHLSATIEKAVRAGAHRVVLNFAGVEYIGSLGIRVLVMQYKLL